MLYRSLETINGWKIKQVKLTNRPEDKNNHITDAVRYATYSILSKPNFGKVCY